MANFVISGLVLVYFGLGLHLGTTDGRGSRLGPALLSMAGTAMALMGFETDPIRRVGPRSLLGLIHDAAFARRQWNHKGLTPPNPQCLCL